MIGQKDEKESHKVCKKTKRKWQHTTPTDLKTTLENACSKKLIRADTCYLLIMSQYMHPSHEQEANADA